MSNNGPPHKMHIEFLEDLKDMIGESKALEFFHMHFGIMIVDAAISHRSNCEGYRKTVKERQLREFGMAMDPALLVKTSDNKPETSYKRSVIVPLQYTNISAMDKTIPGGS